MSNQTAVREKPILFSTPMVQAILEGMKTQTRRIVKSDANVIQWMPIVLNGYGGWCNEHGNPVKCKYEVGDILWVRETWCDYNEGYSEEHAHLRSPEPHYLYRADCKEFETAKIWKPSIFMPRSACRLRLQITDIEVERLQDITPEDCLKEGIDERVFKSALRVATDYMTGHSFSSFQPTADDYRRLSYQSLWEKINGEESWNQNPWVWVISFEPIKS